MNRNSVSRVLLSLFGFGILCLSSCKGFQNADIWVTGMEITQGIQTAASTVPLVATRSTAVRVSLGTDAAQATGPVTGVLTVTVNGTEITPPGGLIQILPVDAQPSPNQNIEDHTLNFELPAPSGITSSSDVDFEVTIAYVNDTDQSNNTFRVDDLSFIDLENPILLFTRIDYTPLGTGLASLSTVDAGSGDAMVQGVFPVVDSDPDLYAPAVPPDFAFNVDYDGNDSLNTGAEASVLFSVLSVFRDLYAAPNGLPLTYTFIYGWFNGSPMSNHAGAGQVGGYSAYGNTTLNRFQRSYAHELGHNFGLPDNNSTMVPDAGWDTDARLENNPAANNTTGRVKPSTFADIMNAGPPTNATWVDAATYSFFYNRMLIETVLPAPSVMRQTSTRVSRTPRKTGVDAAGVLIVHGYFDGGGTQLSHLSPTLHLKNPVELAPKQNSGVFTAMVTSADGKRQSFPFDARVCYEGREQLQHGFFELLIPMSPSQKINKLEIFKTETRERMGGWTMSRPPSVKFNSPDPGGRLGREITVKWNVDDPDTNPGDMLFHLMYSPDAGAQWVPVGVNLSGSSYTFKSAGIPRAKDGQGILKIYACDGLNTVTDQIEGLTTMVSR